MNKNIFRPFFNENTDVLNFIKYNTIGKNKKEYFDYTASGLAFRQIENRIHDVLETMQILILKKLLTLIPHQTIMN